MSSRSSSGSSRSSSGGAKKKGGHSDVKTPAKSGPVKGSKSSASQTSGEKAEGSSPSKKEKNAKLGSGTTVAAVHRSGSRDEEVEEKGEGAQKKEISIAGSITKKPTTKAERRALQEAQRKAKAERQIAASKAGQVAREEKVAKEPKSGSEKKLASGGEVKSLMQQHKSGGHHSSKSHDVAGLKQLQHFSHLPQHERKLRVTNLLKEDYRPPSCVLQLGVQYSEELVCGSNARCIALLAVFKKIIQNYTTPPEKELRRDLDAVIKPHINFLTQCRPLSVSMGNAIKHLKLKISQVPPEMPETEAKQQLCDGIDDYIREKIELASKAISEFCGKIIKDGDVILVHAYSSIVQCCLIDAHRAGKKFRVIVVDSRPKMEGRESLRQLVKEGIKCSYVFINAVSYIMKEVSKVIVGAHGLLANGYVMSRIGTSIIALVAKSYNVPVLVCCETYKFCDKVLTDAFVTNELGDPNDLVAIQRRQGNYLDNWKSVENLQLLNLVYDVTSPDLISMVITQLGNIPCTSVPVVLRISRSYEQM